MLVVLLAASPEAPMSGGVIVPNGGFGGNRKQLIIGGAVLDVSGPAEQNVSYIASQLPATDRHKWWIVIYGDFLGKDPESENIARDFGNHAGLKTLANWAKVWSIDVRSTPAGEARFLATLAAKKSRKLPYVFVVANPDDPVFGAKSPKGWEYAFEGQGYGGDTGMLYRNLYEGIRNQYVSRGLPIEQCPGPFCPPTPDPNPYPDPRSPSPNIPAPQPNREPWDRDPLRPADEPKAPDKTNPVNPQVAPPLKWYEQWYVWAALAALALYVAHRKGWIDQLLAEKTETT